MKTIWHGTAMVLGTLILVGVLGWFAVSDSLDILGGEPHDLGNEALAA